MIQVKQFNNLFVALGLETIGTAIRRREHLRKHIGMTTPSS